MSGANGAKQRQLQRHFKGRYRVIAPELTGNPDESLAVINELIEKVIARRRQIEDNTMTFEQREEMVRNRPQPDTPGCYRLTVLRTYNAYEESGFYATREDAVTEMMSRRCDDKNVIFKIDRIGFGQMASRQFPVEEWMYNNHGELLQKATCSRFHYQMPGIYGKFFGHLSPRRPFGCGMYVRVRNKQGQSVLGIVAGESISTKTGYYNYIQALNSWVRSGNAPDTWVNTTLFPGSDSDEFLVQYGPFDEMMLNFAFFHPMDMLPVTEPLPEEETADLKKWYGDYLKYLEEDDDNDNTQD